MQRNTNHSSELHSLSGFGLITDQEVSGVGVSQEQAHEENLCNWYTKTNDVDGEKFAISSSRNLEFKDLVRSAVLFSPQCVLCHHGPVMGMNHFPVKFTTIDFYKHFP